MEWVEKLGVVPLKADKSKEAPEVDALLVELGNTSRGIPFYAIYPGDGRPPIVFDGFLTQNQVIDKLKEAGPSKPRPRTEVARPDQPPRGTPLGVIEGRIAP